MFRAMKLDHGLGAIGLIALAVALTALLSIGIPISVSKETVELKDWLGFAGNILGAAVTLAAAFIAWTAVQSQIKAQRDAFILDVTAREEDRLEAELATLYALADVTVQVVRAELEHNPEECLKILNDAGIYAEELATRNALQSKTGGPIAAMNFGVLVHKLTSVARAAEGWKWTVNNKHLWEEPDEERVARLLVKGLTAELDKYCDQLHQRAGQILDLLRLYRSRIEGWRSRLSLQLDL